MWRSLVHTFKVLAWLANILPYNGKSNKVNWHDLWSCSPKRRVSHGWQFVELLLVCSQSHIHCHPPTAGNMEGVRCSHRFCKHMASHFGIIKSYVEALLNYINLRNHVLIAVASKKPQTLCIWIWAMRLFPINMTSMKMFVLTIWRSISKPRSNGTWPYWSSSASLVSLADSSLPSSSSCAFSTTGAGSFLFLGPLTSEIRRFASLISASAGPKLDLALSRKSWDSETNSIYHMIMYNVQVLTRKDKSMHTQDRRLHQHPHPTVQCPVAPPHWPTGCRGHPDEIPMRSPQARWVYGLSVDGLWMVGNGRLMTNIRYFWGDSIYHDQLPVLWSFWCCTSWVRPRSREDPWLPSSTLVVVTLLR